MGIELDIPGNTLKDRANKQAEAQIEKLEIKPLELRGEVEVKKKGLLVRLGEALLPADMELTKENLWNKIVVPSVKDLIFNAFEEFLFGSNGRRSRSNSSSPLDRPSYVNYVNYSKDSDRDRRQSTTRSSSERDFDYRHIYFKVEEDATDCLHSLADILDHYPQVTIGHLYDFLGKPTQPSLFDFGWRNLRDAEVVKERNGGATLYLPRAIPLD